MYTPGNYQQDVPERSIVLVLHCSASMFIGKKRSNAPSIKSQSVSNYIRFEGDEFQAKLKRHKRKMEEWDAKGGFNIQCGQQNSRI